MRAPVSRHLSSSSGPPRQISLKTLKLKLAMRENRAAIGDIRYHLRFLHDNYPELCKDFFNEMARAKQNYLDAVTCNIMLKAAGRAEEVNSVIGCMVRRNIEMNLTCLVSALRSCSPQDALRMFKKINDHFPYLRLETSVWNLLLSKFSGDEDKMLWVINEMKSNNAYPDRETVETYLKCRFDTGGPPLNFLLQLFALNDTQSQGQDPHLCKIFPELTKEQAFQLQQIFFELEIPGIVLKPWIHSPLETKQPTVTELNVGLALASKIGRVPLTEAWNQFSIHGVWPDVVSWNTAIKGCGLFSDLSTIMQFFHCALKSVKPTDVTFLNTITACARKGALAEALQVYGMIGEYSIVSNEKHRNAVLSAAAKSERPEQAFGLLEKLFESEGSAPDRVSYRTLLGAALELAKRGERKLAKERISEIFRKCNTVEEAEVEIALETFSYCNDLENARSLWEGTSFKTPMGASILLSHLGKAGELDECHRVFDQLEKPGLVEHNSLLYACALSYDVQRAEAVFDKITSREDLKPDAFTFNSLLEAHGRMMNIATMEEIMFKEMPKFLVVPSEVTHTSYLSACARAGEEEKAFNFFTEHIEVGEVRLSHLTALLEVCAKNNPIRSERVISMFSKHGISLDVRASNIQIACLAKLGKFFMAETVFSKIENPTQVSYHTLLDALARFEHLEPTEKLERARKLISDMEMQGLDLTTATFSPLFKMCKEDMSLLQSVKEEMKERGLWGIHKVVATFWKDGKAIRCANGRGFTGENSEFLDFTDETERMLAEISYKPDPEGVPIIFRHNGSPDEIQESLSFHAEKKALAHLLFSTRSNEKIHVVVDQRMCQDCRGVFAKAASHYGRKIMCRDGRQVHVFEPVRAEKEQISTLREKDESTKITAVKPSVSQLPWVRTQTQPGGISVATTGTMLNTKSKKASDGLTHPRGNSVKNQVTRHIRKDREAEEMKTLPWLPAIG